MGIKLQFIFPLCFLLVYFVEPTIPKENQLIKPLYASLLEDRQSGVDLGEKEGIIQCSSWF